jgi:3-oxoacyl-(acyl-carrier-protein) synthase
MKPVYIHGTGNVSPQPAWDVDILSEPVNYSGSRLKCIEPDYTKWVDVKQIRRMSRVMKMGTAAAMLALKNAEVTNPDAIITGTGLGCLDDTGNFLNRISEFKEETLNPTPFIQSTHNTIGSHVAFLLQCQAYNQTYSQGPFSFENALLDSQLMLNENPELKILTGSADEITETSQAIMGRFGIFKNSANSLDLFKSKSKGTMHGEGSAWFVLSGQKGNAKVSVAGVQSVYKPDNINTKIDEFLSFCGKTANQIDFVLSGKSGDSTLDASVDRVLKSVFPDASTGVYKHLCGEYYTSSSFAVWLAWSILNSGVIPPTVLEKGSNQPPKSILIYNQYFQNHHTLILLNRE